MSEKKIDVARLRELHTKLGHAERFRPGEPTNLTRFAAAAADAMPTLLDVYEAASAPLPVVKVPDDIDDATLAKLRALASRPCSMPIQPAPVVPHRETIIEDEEGQS